LPDTGEVLPPPPPSRPPVKLVPHGQVPKSGVQQMLLLVIQLVKLEALDAISLALMKCVWEIPSLSKSFVVMAFKVKLGSVQLDTMPLAFRAA
jgi:hypothetical protein